MKTLKFYGSSDDCFIVDGDYVDEQDNCADGSTQFYVVKKGKEGLIVTGQYAPNGMPGVWTIGVAQLDEDVPLPTWPMRFEVAERAYSTMLILEAPDGCKVFSGEELED